MCSRTEPKTNAKTSSSIGTPTPKHNRGKRKYTCQESECHILGHRHLDHSDCRREQKHPQLSMPSSQKESPFPKDSPRKPERSRLTGAASSPLLSAQSASSFRSVKVGSKVSHSAQNILFLFGCVRDSVSCSIPPVGGGAERGIFASVSIFASKELFFRATGSRCGAFSVCSPTASFQFLAAISTFSGFGKHGPSLRIATVDFRPARSGVHATNSCTVYADESCGLRTKTPAFAPVSLTLGAVAGTAG